MDVFSQLQLITPDMSNYAKKHDLSGLFQNMLERLIIDRPDAVVGYLLNILKVGYHDTLRVMILGSSTVEVKLMSATLELDMDLVHLTRESLIEYANSSLEKELKNFDNISEVTVKLWTDIVKSRVEQPDCLTKGWLLENFPQTRAQAFFLLKKGIYPTHIVVVEGDASSEKVKKLNIENCVQSDLIIDVFNSSSVTRCDSHLQSADLILCGENFVKQKQKQVILPLPRIILFGPFGSGKKSMGFLLAVKYKLVQISFTEILRQAAMKDGPLKQQIHEILSSDELINDEFLAKVVAERLNQTDCISRGWVMYDFPTNVSQAEYLTQFLEPYQVNKAIFLEINLNTCIQRFKLKNKNPIESGLSYSDANIEESFMAFQVSISPLQEFFSRNLQDDIAVSINAEDSIDSVFEMVENVVLGPAKRNLQSREWWKWCSRNSGVY